MAEELMRNIQWFPGHMTKTRRMIAANLSLVDAVVEILDARVPQSSRNPEMDRMLGNKPRMLLLNMTNGTGLPKRKPCPVFCFLRYVLSRSTIPA